MVDDSREMLDTMMQGTTTAGRKEYGALSAIERDVVKKALANMTKTGGMGWLDVISGTEFVTGLLTMNPKLLVESGALGGFNLYRKIWKDPNRKIRGMFEDIEKLIGTKERVGKPFEPQSRLGRRLFPQQQPPPKVTGLALPPDRRPAVSTSPVPMGGQTLPRSAYASQVISGPGVPVGQPYPTPGQNLPAIQTGRAVVPQGGVRSIYPPGNPIPVSQERLSIANRRIEPAQAMAGYQAMKPQQVVQSMVKTGASPVQIGIYMKKVGYSGKEIRAYLKILKGTPK